LSSGFGINLELDHCIFPDELFYDLDNNTWTQIDSTNHAIVGVTSLLSAIAGKLTSVRLKKAGTTIRRGESLGTLESIRFVGPVPSPISGVISSVNDLVIANPKLLNDSPYGSGWIARIIPAMLQSEMPKLATVQDSKPVLQAKILQFRARCFKAFPDHEMYEIGIECSATLVHLNELMAKIPIGDVVHLVSDDPTAYVEMEVWKDKTRQNLVEWRKENNLFHFIVRKAA
jgi:glycine cleavage system H lipoate-binding protein/TusA-related sulfurtransferase